MGRWWETLSLIWKNGRISLLSSFEKTGTREQDKNRNIFVETSLNEISHVFIRGRRKGLVKIYTDGGAVEGMYLERGNTILHFLAGRILSRVKHLVDFVWETFQRHARISSFLLPFFLLFILQNREKNGEEESMRILFGLPIGME